MRKNQSHNIKEYGNKGFEKNIININIISGKKARNYNIDRGRVIINDIYNDEVNTEKKLTENAITKNTNEINIIKKKGYLDLKNEKKRKDKMKHIICIIITIFIAIFAVIAILKIKEYLENLNKHSGAPPQKEEIIYGKEILKANIVYRPGDIYLFKSVEKTSLITDGEKANQDNSTYNISVYRYYLLMIEKEYKEISNNTIFNYYSGIFSQINSTIQSQTHLMLWQFDENVTKILNKKNEKNLTRTEMNNLLDDTSKNGTEPFFKVDFYQNGKIKNIFTPKDIIYQICMK
jgi:hypothetical protein